MRLILKLRHEITEILFQNIGLNIFKDYCGALRCVVLRSHIAEDSLHSYRHESHVLPLAYKGYFISYDVLMVRNGSVTGPNSSSLNVFHTTYIEVMHGKH